MSRNTACNLGIIGFVSLLTVHILTFVKINLFYILPLSKIIIPLVLMTFIPALLSIGRRRIRDVKDISMIFEFTPKIVRALTLILFLYATYNIMILIVTMSGGSPSIVDGEYVLATRGTIGSVITYDSYVKYNLYSTRCLSGFFLVFYSISLAILMTAKRINRKS